MLTVRSKYAVTVWVFVPWWKTRNAETTSTITTAITRIRLLKRLRRSFTSSPAPRDELAAAEADEVGDVGVEPRAGPDDVDQDGRVGPEVLHGRVQLLLAGLEELRRGGQLGERVLDLLLVVGRDATQRDRQTVGVDEQGVDRLATCQQLLEDEVALLHQRDEVALALGQQPGHPLGAAEQLLDRLVAAGDRLRDAGQPGERRLDVRAGGVQGVPERAQRLRQLGGVDVLGA